MVFSSISDLWNQWNIRGFVLLSLSLQVFLIIFSPIRKKTRNDRIIFLLWLAYLLADWVAAFAIGLISHNQGNLCTHATVVDKAAFAIGFISHNQGNLCTHATEVDEALQAFWASFLLLHLGGPDTITAFSLEDSSLWRRHLLSLIFQISAAIYVFVQIFPSDRSLMIPTILVFLAGVIKNAERIAALNLSSLPRLKEWVLSQREFVSANVVPQINTRIYTLLKTLIEKYDRENVAAPSESTVVETAAPRETYDWENVAAPSETCGWENVAAPSESTVVEIAYLLFQIIKIFLGDLVFTFNERYTSRSIFCHIPAMEALRLLSVELQFIYEVLHTKTLAIRSKLSCIFRFITFMGVVMAFVLFNRLKKHQLSKVDVKITYILLFGGIVIDVISLFMLIFSDWTLAENMQNNSELSRLYSLLYKLAYDKYKLRKSRYATCKAKPADVTYEALDTPLIFRRWSESISACNLLSMSLKESPRSLGSIASPNLFDFGMAEKIFFYFHQAGETITKGCGWRTTKGEKMITKTKYVSKNPFLKELWLFIYEELRRKSRIEEELRRKSRIEEELRHGSGSEELRRESRSRLDSKIWKDVRKIYEARGDLYLENLSDENIVLPEDLKLDFITFPYDDNIIIWHIATEIMYNKEEITEKNKRREFSKILSDYMMYLLLNQPNVMSAVVGIAQITIAETLGELGELEKSLPMNDATQDLKLQWLCQKLFERPTESLREGQHPKSMLRQGIDLAKKMENLEEMKWKVMSGVWVEMLSYAAVHIKGEVHVQVLSKGGELLAFIWLLMAHFGWVCTPELGPYYARTD